MIAIIFIFALLYFYLANKRKAYLILYFFVFTNGFQLFPSNFWFIGFSAIDKPNDILLIATVGIIALDVNRILSFLRQQVFTGYLLLLLLMVGIGSLIATNSNVSYFDQIRVMRTELVVFTVLPFVTFKSDDFRFILLFLYRVTFFLCILYFLQPFVKQTLLFNSGADAKVLVNADDATGWLRYYNMPLFAPFFLFYSFLKLREKASVINIVMFSVFLFAIIVPLFRGLLVSILLALVVSDLIFFFSARRLLITLGVALCLGVTVFCVPTLSTRFIEGWHDFTSFDESALMGISIEGDSTFTFRIMHLWERITFLSKDILSFLFGIGLVPDYVPAASRLPLHIGNYVKDLGAFQVIDSSDLVWSTPLLRFGILGVLAIFYFIYFFIKQIKPFKQDKLAAAAIIYVVCALLSSFTGAELIRDHFKILLLLISIFFVKRLASHEHLYSNTVL